MQQQVLKFWFSHIDRKKWWVKDDDFDALIRDKFVDIHSCANKCELSSWRVTARGRLAEIIVLDQFSRNIYRGHVSSFASYSLALALAQEAILFGAEQQLTDDERGFLLLPFMHSESRVIHQQALPLYQMPGLEQNLKFELKHKTIIDRFGRYPHRNKILGRTSTEAEIEFLQQPNSSF